MLTAEVSRVMPILDWCSNGVGRVLGSGVGGGLGGGWDHGGDWEGLVVGRGWWKKLTQPDVADVPSWDFRRGLTISV